ncbi:nicotinamidase [Corynebacterium kutscheri]|uniref:nicotinamidase n=1 Tax=Corynebacterium kutscheri TaxID=35755 RepID=A0A0F6TDF8_9CORY|nr:nicotinamidase [Corynebacterium kutscheri]AKE40849.1 nicotinamidase-like amidase [Corynebacterium kutscheri]VEH06580.1 Isochorismatase family protein yddQ [Corynebacterium kutscheri]VEH09146.1 Isochorismatase family protein yddQ [Corynebacterium kutscheri]
MRALVVVDVQNDFCPGGSLATKNGSIVAHRIADYIAQNKHRYNQVIATKDWHIEPGDHFSDTPDFIDSWPVHCVADSQGAELHPALATTEFDEVFLKGQYSAAYSGFEGASASDETPLNTWLDQRNVSIIDVAGIATDYCVKATVLDGLKAGFETKIFSDLVSAVNEETGDKAIQEMLSAGSQIA